MKKKNSTEPYFGMEFASLRTSFQPGEEVEGVISAITPSTIFIDVNARSEGILERKDVEVDESYPAKLGDKVRAFFSRESKGGELFFTLKTRSSPGDEASIEHSYRAKIPIEGRVEKERKGGFEVHVGHRQAFCPYSQIDIRRSESSIHLGKTYSFLILEYSRDNLVLSRRKQLEKEKEKAQERLQKNLQEGDIISGVVTQKKDFGTFVEIAPGIEGLIPKRELSWKSIQDEEDTLCLGEKISVKVLHLQWQEQRITLSLRQATEHPWVQAKEKYLINQPYPGIITNCTDFGAFVELDPGIEGLLHRSQMKKEKTGSSASDALTKGKEITVFVINIDVENQRISLSLEPSPDTIETTTKMFIPGATIKGTVDAIEYFGIFVKLNPQKSGLLPLREITFHGTVNKVKDMHKRYPINSSLSVVIKEIKQEKISLSLAETGEDNFEDDTPPIPLQTPFGNVGSIFDNIL